MCALFKMLLVLVKTTFLRRMKNNSSACTLTILFQNLFVLQNLPGDVHPERLEPVVLRRPPVVGGDVEVDAQHAAADGVRLKVKVDVDL